MWFYANFHDWVRSYSILQRLKEGLKTKRCHNGLSLGRRKLPVALGDDRAQVKGYGTYPHLVDAEPPLGLRGCIDKVRQALELLSGSCRSKQVSN